MIFFICWIFARLIWEHPLVFSSAVPIPASTSASINAKTDQSYLTAGGSYSNVDRSTMNGGWRAADQPGAIPRRTNRQNTGEFEVFRDYQRVDETSSTGELAAIKSQFSALNRPAAMEPKAAGPERQSVSANSSDAVLKRQNEILDARPGERREASRDKPAVEKRLSGYIWVFVRDDSESSTDANSSFSGPLSGQYGGSQIGAILNYRVAGHSSNDLSIFARASTALAISGEEELAVGAKIKPIAKLPVAIYAEQRFGGRTADNRGTTIFAAGGLGPVGISETIDLEAYAQAGYVFRDQDSYFFDGSAILRRSVAQQGDIKIYLGGGVWAGGQRGVSRLDVGPRMSADIPIGQLAMRLAVDWRQRVAGDARPDSGVAMTLTTGF